MDVFDLKKFESDLLTNDSLVFQKIVSQSDEYYSIVLVWNRYFINLNYCPKCSKYKYFIGIDDCQPALKKEGYRNKKIVDKIRTIIEEETEKRKTMFFNFFIEYLLINQYIIHISSYDELRQELSLKCHTNDYSPLARDGQNAKLQVGLSSKKSRRADCSILIDNEPILVFQEKKRRLLDSMTLLKNHNLEFLLLRDSSEEEINEFIDKVLPKNFIRYKYERKNQIPIWQGASK